MDPSSGARFTLLAVFLLSLFSIPSIESKRYGRSLSEEELGDHKNETLTHIHFYLYSRLTGPQSDVVRVAQASTTNQSLTNFGAVNVVDEPMLLEPNETAQVIGRFQGLSAFASQTELALIQAFNFAFTYGEYNGSTLTTIGRNPVLEELRETPIVGGTGVFRFARGYAQSNTVFNGTVNGINVAIGEYNLYVYHY